MILGVDPGLAACGWAVVDPSTMTVRDLGVILTERDSSIDEALDRERRASFQADKLIEVAVQYNCGAIAGESMSFGGPPAARFRMAISIGLSWGAAIGVARTLGISVFTIPPKIWQRAVVPTSAKRVPYAKVEAELQRFAAITAGRELAAIIQSKRNHALDACGVALFAALRPSETQRVIGRKAA